MESWRGYLVVAPSVFRAGVEEAVSVTIFNPIKETAVQVQLVVKGETVARAHSTILGKGTITLKVPSGLRGQAHLEVWGNRHLAKEGYIFHNYTTVTIDSKGASVFIQTDKPTYRPKQKVLINLFTVSPELRPVSERVPLAACGAVIEDLTLPAPPVAMDQDLTPLPVPSLLIQAQMGGDLVVEAYVLDPRGSRMIEWNNLKPVCCGVLNMSFPLSDQPVFGEWFVFAEMQGHVYNKSFEVQNLGLWIEPPPTSIDLSITRRVRACQVHICRKPVAGNWCFEHDSQCGVRVATGMKLGTPILIQVKCSGGIDGTAHFDVCVGDMVPVDIPEHFRGVVSIWAMVTAADGNKQVTFDDSTPVQKQLVDIRYSKDTRKQFKPGLPYRGKVEVTYPDGSPADRVTVQVKAELMPKDNIYTSELTSRGGLVLFEIPSIPAAAQFIWLETKVTATDGKPVGDHYLPNYLSISSWYSPSKCYLQLQMLDRPFLVGDEASMAVKSTCPCNFTLHYEVVSRGNIVLSGLQSSHVTQQRSRRAAASSSRSIHAARLPGTVLGLG
uniref:Uncharacterized protein n=1 Tax=Sphaerodactylus townsendi TaxID=933632 RepID=A0ACB8F101_9SAUR